MDAVFVQVVDKPKAQVAEVPAVAEPAEALFQGKVTVVEPEPDVKELPEPR